LPAHLRDTPYVGRIDADHVQVRRAICWNDQSLSVYHAKGWNGSRAKESARPDRRPWAIRYSLSHLVKDEVSSRKKIGAERADCVARSAGGWIPHGSFGSQRVGGGVHRHHGSAHLRVAPGNARRLGQRGYRQLAWQQLPRIIDHGEPLDCSLNRWRWKPASILTSAGNLPTSDDQQAGLIGAAPSMRTDGDHSWQLGVVNSSSSTLPSPMTSTRCAQLGPYLWMRCYTNEPNF